MLRSRVFLCLFAALLAAASLFGQVAGRLSGSVVDQTGAAIPGATVTITSVDRQTSDTVVTNESGRYVKDRLLPGQYEVKAELSGFKAAVFSNVAVNVDTQTKLDVKLEIGQLTESVTVTGFSPLPALSATMSPSRTW